MPSRTLFLGRLFGLYCLVFSCIMFARKQAILDAITAILGNPGTMLTLGVLLLFAGLAMVLTHNIWSGGALPVIITLIGWMTLAKAVLLLFLPAPNDTQIYLAGLHYAQFFYVYAAVTLCLGVYLTASAFRTPSRA